MAARSKSQPVALPSGITSFRSFVQERDFAARQHRGRRENQEDYYSFADATSPEEEPLSKLLLVVGDGLGAHTGGSVASYLAVGAFIKAFHENELSGSWRLRVALEAANETIGMMSSRLPQVEQMMGTTLVGVIITPTTLQWISVGDSPLFLFREGKLIRLNADHSLAPMLDERVAKGEITPEEAAHHPDRHTLQSALLGVPMTLVDTVMDPVPLNKGDIIIAASDGIFTLSNKQLEDLLSFGKHTTADKIADAIIFSIRRINYDRQDNITVGVVKIS
ncbi:MAG: serine/threonine-protein phosphatase [Verrucomicrobiaceae bacterium]|nr:serine/threonine-protein phosphatase [Verrucomicrobiaceae bacterium]